MKYTRGVLRTVRKPRGAIKVTLETANHCVARFAERYRCECTPTQPLGAAAEGTGRTIFQRKMPMWFMITRVATNARVSYRLSSFSRYNLKIPLAIALHLESDP